MWERGKSSQKAIKMVRGYSYTLAIIPKFSTEFVDRNKNLLHILGFIKCPYFLKINVSDNFFFKLLYVSGDFQDDCLK
jgi:hypothetical protein